MAKSSVKDSTGEYRENILNSSESKYKDLFENSGTSVIIVNIDGFYLYANERAAKNFNCKPEEIEGKSMFDLLPAEIAGRYLEKNRETILSGKARDYEDTFNLPVGERTFFIVDHVLLDDNGMGYALQSNSIDITLLKRADNALHENEQYLHILFETMTEGVALNEMVFDENGEMIDYRILQVNKAFFTTADFRGVKVEGSLATKLYGMSEDYIRSFWKEHLKKNTTSFTEMWSPLKKRCYFVSTSPFSGNRFVTSFLDITSRKLTEEALKKSEERFRQIAESAGEWIWEVDRNGVYTYVNSLSDTFLGYKTDEILGKKHFYDFFSPEVRDNLKKMAFRVFENKGRFLKFENRNIHKDGHIVILETTGLPIIGDNGKLVGYRGADTDITERKIAEESLKKSEANLRSLIENTEGSIWSIDGNFCLIDANWRFYENFKKGTGRLLSVGDNVLTDLPSDIKKDWGKYYKRGMKGECFNIQAFTKAPLEPHFYRYSFNPIKTTEGEVIGLSIIGQDITDHKMAEENLKKSAEELRELSEYLEDVRETERTKIAHDLHDDLGQKLTALNMDISWLKSRIGVQSRGVENKLNQMSELLNETIESIGKISFGLRPSILDDLGLYSAIEWQLSEFEKSTGISSSLSFVPRQASVDKKISLVVFRIIQESLTNVARHSMATTVSVTVISKNSKLKLMIRDNGIGIDHAKLTSHKSFGLIGMRERAGTINGKVNICGIKGKGTVITLTIPLTGKTNRKGNSAIREGHQSYL